MLIAEAPKYPYSPALTFDRIMRAELLTIMQTRQIQRVQVYSFSNSRLRSQSAQWLLKEQVIQVGEKEHELHKIAGIRTVAQTFQLYV